MSCMNLITVYLILCAPELDRQYNALALQFDARQVHILSNFTLKSKYPVINL